MAADMKIHGRSGLLKEQRRKNKGN